MGNLKAVTSESEYDVISNEPWVNGRIYFLKSIVFLVIFNFDLFSAS